MLEVLISPETMPVGSSPLVTAGYIFQLLISLAVVIGLIYFSAKYLFPKLQMPSKGQMIQVLDRVGLEPQVSAYVLTSLGNTYIVLVSNKSATLIDKIESGSDQS